VEFVRAPQKHLQLQFSALSALKAG
jgi:hypothetical protein